MGTPTGRFTKTHPNLQVIPIRTPEGQAIRQALETNMAKKPMTQKQAEALAERRRGAWNQDYQAAPDLENPGYWTVVLNVPDQSWFHAPMGTFKSEPSSN